LCADCTSVHIDAFLFLRFCAILTGAMQTPIGAETLVGRDEELARLCAFLDGRGNGSATAFLLEGEPGMGKTALSRSGVAYAHELEFRVLVARPSEPERMLSFATLADLLADVHDVIGGLPAVQRLPLSVALLLEDEHGVAPDRRAIGVALLATLRTLVQDRPLLIAVDDVQWVDAPSAAALAFALRRVAGEPLCVLVAERTGSGSALRLELERALPLERLTLGPLSRLRALSLRCLRNTANAASRARNRARTLTRAHSRLPQCVPQPARGRAHPALEF
jgi:hypothetical protein